MSGARVRGFGCPHCGRPLARRRGARPPGVLEIACPECRFRMFDYPRICAGMLVLRGDRVLLLVRGHPPRKGWIDLPGGFLEAGESPERAARRELEEETGLLVGSVRPLGLYWDRYFLRGFGYFPTMNFYYLGRWRGGELRPADDAARAEWVPRTRITALSRRFAWRHMGTLFRDLGRRRGQWA